MNTPTLSRMAELSEQPRTLEALERFVNTVASHRTVDDGLLAEAISGAQTRLAAVLILYLDDDLDDKLLELARECAALAIEAGFGNPTDNDGNCMLPTEPMVGDWDALEELLGRRPTDDESDDFDANYTEIVDAQRARNLAEREAQ